MTLKPYDALCFTIIINGMEWHQRVKRRRQELGLNQQQLADRIGVEQSAVSHWETGKRVPVHLSQFDRIAKALECSTAWLLFGVTTPKDQRVAHVLEVMEKLPDYKVDVIVQVTDTLATGEDHESPMRKASGAN
jgi:transcriptional regulator with XRE-family HTH domain